MKRLWNLCLPLGVIFVLALAACQNPVDLVDEVTRVVMEANDRYVEVTEIFPEAGENDINASAVISVDFDRSIDPLSLEGNITVRYNGDEDGSNRISEDWEILYNETLRRLTIDASPWLDSNRTITVTLENLTGVDGSTMQEKKEWSFQTNNDAAFNLTIDEEYANISNHTAVPLTLEFSSSENLWYYLSDDSSLTQLTIPVFNPSGGDWTEVTALEMGDVFSFSTEGSSVPLYLWVYEDGDGGAGVLSNNNKTETDYILVDLTMPTVSLGGAVYTNSAHTFTVEADDENGIASYLWTGPADCSFATPEAVSTEVSSDVEGLHELTVTVTDTAGNSAQASVDMIWDTTAPAALSSAPDLAASYDTGSSNSDNITAKWEELLFTGSSEAEAEIELYGDGELFGTTVADGSGSWSVTAEDFSGGEKEYVITAYSVDRAGNRSDPSPELILKVDTVAPSGSFSLPSTTSDNSVSASLTYTDDSGLWYYRFRNDGSSSWTYDYTPGSSENLTLRNNAGLRRVYLYVYDRAGNGRYTYDTINFYMPVEVQLYGFHSDYDYDGGGTEQWYWTLYVNGRSAFVRPEAGAVSYNMPGILNSASAYFKYASSALPYTYTVNVDVSSSSTDNLSLGGTIWEVDSLINSYGTFSTTTVDTNLRSLGTSVWAESVIQTTAYTITKYYLNYLEVGYYYRAVTAYAALDS